MSLIQTVVAIVRERGEASEETITVAGKTPVQIRRALQNAAHLGLIHTAKTRSRGHHKGRAPNIYGPGQRKQQTQPVSSVFDLGRV